jgi:hypothetical protein
LNELRNGLPGRKSDGLPGRRDSDELHSLQVTFPNAGAGGVLRLIAAK